MSRLSSACYAPHSALYFEPNGVVQACCATGFDLGRVNGPGRQTLREIWEGANVRAQRAALERGGYEYGCQECEMAAAAAGRPAALSVHFDRWADGATHPFPQMMDFALSNRCNLQCVMCNGGLSSAIRAQREGLPPLPPGYDDAFFAELEEFLPHVARLHFKGGEPFLARENRRIWDYLIAHRLRAEVAVTTNGTIFNGNVERYVRELHMHPIVSIDGIHAETLEAIRVGVAAETLWKNVDRLQSITDETGAGMTLSFCLMAQNWREALGFLEESDRRGVNGNIVFVNQPHRFDLLRLPHDDLVAVHDELRRLPTDFRAGEPDRVWNEVLERIRSQIEHPVELVVTSAVIGHRRATGPAALEPDMTADAFAVEARLVRDYGTPALHLTVSDSRVVGIDEPAWAAWLRAGEWVGLVVETLGDHLGRELGPVVSGPMSSEIPGIARWSVRITVEQTVRAIDVYLASGTRGITDALIFPARDPGDAPTARW